jgi:hypothetical protein
MAFEHAPLAESLMRIAACIRPNFAVEQTAYGRGCVMIACVDSEPCKHL